METVTATGMVISSMPISEYDKRLVLLTKEFGKITAFARGARRVNSALLAASQPMVMGQFTLYQGREAYNLNSVKMTKYFGDELKDFDKISLAAYFMEVAEYFGHENEGAGQMLNLLYVSMKALSNKKIPDMLIRYVYELKMLVINGEYPEVFSCVKCGSKENINTFDTYHHGVLCDECVKTAKMPYIIKNSALYAMQYIVSAPIDRLYTFNVSDEVLKQLKDVIGTYFKSRVDRNFKSLRFIEL